MLDVPHLNYCITIWANSFSSHTDILQKLQNRLSDFMFKYYHGALPPNLRHSFLRVCDKYHYLTRAVYHLSIT